MILFTEKAESFGLPLARKPSFVCMRSRIALILSIAFFMGVTAHVTLAAPTLPPPPALAIGERLLAQNDYQAAVNKLSQITTSATYKNTEYAPEALYKIAHIYADNLHDSNSAMTSYNSLVNTYRAADYPEKSLVSAERTALAKRIDDENAHAAKIALATAGGDPWKIVGGYFNQFLYNFIAFFVNLTGAKSYSYWIALLLISFIVRGVLTPLTIKQYKSMRETQRLQPLMKELQAKYKDNRELLNQKTMALYKEHGVNPVAGCLPLLLQLPIFYAMYHAVWLYQYHFIAGTFLWINPVISKMSAKLLPNVIAPNLSQQDLILLFLYTVSMYVTQRMMPQNDPTQAEVQKTTALFTAVFFFMFFQNSHFPSAFVLYWLISNVLSTATQMYFMRQGNAPAPGVKATFPSDGDNPGNGGSRNGSSPILPSSGTSISTNGSKPTSGTARGVIAPRTHPKKRKR